MHKLFSLLLPALVCSCATGGRHGAVNSHAQAQFERLKKLEGHWITVQETGTEPAGIAVRYHVVGGGSALVETLFASSVQEMVTVYHLDGSDLVLTHYCSLANQPHMRAAPTTEDGVLEFTCDGGANFDPATDTHMHQVAFRFTDDTHLRATWTLYEKGHPAEVAHFALVRSWQ